MKRETLLRALLALVVVLLLWGAFALFGAGLSDEPIALALPEVATAQIDQVEITTGGDTLLLSRASAAGWTVNGRPAAQETMEQVLTALPDSAWSADLVARSPSSHAPMGVDSATGHHAVFQSGDQVVLDLWIGDTGRDFQSRYVRLAGADQVYLFRGRLANLLTRAPDAWRERNIATVATDSVGSLIVENPEGGYTLVRGDSGWTVDGTAADTALVGRTLDELASLRAAAFPTPEQEDIISFASPERALTVTLRNGDRLFNLLFDSTQAGYWVRHDSGGTIWRMDGWRVERITPAESLLVGG